MNATPGKYCVTKKTGNKSQLLIVRPICDVHREDETMKDYIQYTAEELADKQITFRVKKFSKDDEELFTWSRVNVLLDTSKKN